MTETGDLRALRRGTVTLAVIASVARGLLPGVLVGSWVGNPDITVSVSVAGSADAAAMVGAGEADIAQAFEVRVPRNARRLAAAMLPTGPSSRRRAGLPDRKRCGSTIWPANG